MVASIARNSTNTRLYWLGALLILWGGAICLRLVYLQIFCYGQFEQRAQHQQLRTTEVAARRGIIYDRASRELAMSILVESVFAVPGNPRKAGPGAMATTTPIAAVTAKECIDPTDRFTSARQIAARRRPRGTLPGSRAKPMRRPRAGSGLSICAASTSRKESKRFYPKRELAAQVLGYVGTDDEGLSGIEREFNEQLSGKPGRILISVDAHKKWFSSVEKEPEPGENVVLTIDQQIQYIAERELETAMRQTHAQTGTVIVENPYPEKSWRWRTSRPSTPTTRATSRRRS